MTAKNGAEPEPTPGLILNVSQKMRTASFIPLLGVSILLAISAFAAELSEAEIEKERLAAHQKYAEQIGALTSRADSYIVSELVKKKGLLENPVARRYAMHDLDGDKKDDLLLIATFEFPTGGNAYECRLLVVLSSLPTEVQDLIVGGLGSRDADQFVEENGLHLFLRFRVWARTDAQCCPSLATTDEVVFAKGRVALQPFDAIKRKP